MTATAEDDPELGVDRRSALRRLGLSPIDAVVLVSCTLFIVVFLPPLVFEGWTPRMAILLTIGPLGLALAAMLAARRDWSAILALSAVSWTVVAALTTGSARSAIIGFVGRDLSALVFACGVGAWAIGRQMSATGRVVLTWLFVGACTASAAVGILQVLLEVRAGSLALFGDRPSGFVVNPVYFGATSAAGLAVATERFASTRGLWWAAGLCCLGVAVSLSGSRVALAGGLLTILTLVVVRRTRATGLAASSATVSLAMGVAIDRAFGPGSNAADRLGDTGGGRTDVWRYGLSAFLERPMFGYGFGRFRPAVQQRFSSSFVRDFAQDESTQPWFDAHNAFVGVLVAVGVVGAILIAAWVGIWARQVRGPLAWGLLPIAMHWLLQPVSIITLPLAMILFGASGPMASSGDQRRQHWLVLPVTIGALLGVTVLGADITLRTAIDDADSRLAASVSDVYLDDPIVDDIVAQLIAADPERPNKIESVLRWRERSTRAEPDRPRWWLALADVQIEAGTLRQAATSIARARQLQPISVRASITELRLAVETDDQVRVTELLTDLCSLGVACDLVDTATSTSVNGR